MREEDAFIAALKADPSDEATRLVYADWLEERGDVRGELIRLESRMSQLAPSCDEFAGLKPRRTALRAGADAEWLKAMGYVPRHRPLFTKLPERRVERWRLVEEFIDTWYRPLAPGDGCAEKEITAAERRLGFRLPAALREWHTLAGRREDVFSSFNRLIPVSALEIDGERDALIIQRECQNCEQWAIRRADLGLDDPPVIQLVGRNESCATTTEFAWLIMFIELQSGGGTVQGLARLREPTAQELFRSRFVESSFSARYRTESPFRFFEGTGLFLGAVELDLVLFTAQSETDLDSLRDLVSEALEIFERP